MSEWDRQGQVLLTALSPHPPLLIPEIGREHLVQVEKTRQAMETLGQTVVGIQPDVVVVISPHGPVLEEGIALWGGEKLQGDFGQFGAPRVSLEWSNDRELLRAVIAAGAGEEYTLVELDEVMARTYGWQRRLDYATLVPLYYLAQAGVDASLLSLGMGLLPYPTLYRFGTILKEAILRTGRRAVVIASGDLSHRLMPGAPAGYSPSGKVFDEKLWELLQKGNFAAVLDLDKKLIQQAGECGLRPLIMMLGCLEGREVRVEALSYEGPFGVGYGVCLFHPGQERPERRLFPRLGEDAQENTSNSQNRPESPLVSLARRAVAARVRGESLPQPDASEFPPDLPERAGVFVSIKKRGELRGCIGTIAPTQPALAEEIIYNAIQAATADPRFPPVTAEELPELTFSVDVLSEPEAVDSIEELDPRRYGVIVQAGGRRGLLLPDLPGIDTPETQVAIARRKAGISGHVPVKLFRFEVKRYH